MRTGWRNRWVYAALAFGASYVMSHIAPTHNVVVAASCALTALVLFPRAPATEHEMSLVSLAVVGVGYIASLTSILVDMKIAPDFLLYPEPTTLTVGAVVANIKGAVLLLFYMVMLSFGLPFALGAALSRPFAHDEAAKLLADAALDAFVNPDRSPKT